LGIELPQKLPMRTTGVSQRRRIMHKFSYRTPRFAVDIPVRLILPDFRSKVVCTEICIDGMRIEAPEPLTINALGAVFIRCDDGELQINVRVVRSNNIEQALEFIFTSRRDRTSLARMIATWTGLK
jgi:PilZ domain